MFVGCLCESPVSIVEMAGKLGEVVRGKSLVTLLFHIVQTTLFRSQPGSYSSCFTSLVPSTFIQHSRFDTLKIQIETLVAPTPSNANTTRSSTSNKIVRAITRVSHIATHSFSFGPTRTCRTPLVVDNALITYLLSCGRISNLSAQNSARCRNPLTKFYSWSPASSTLRTVV